MQRTIIAKMFHTIVTGVQQYRPFETLSMWSQDAARNQSSDGSATGHRSEEQAECAFGIVSGKRFGVAEFTQNRAGLRMVSLHVRKADTIHPCWVKAVGQTGKQAGDVEEDV